LTVGKQLDTYAIPINIIAILPIFLLLAFITNTCRAATALKND
jgi:hypothetical protein